MAACWKVVWNVDPLPFSVPESLAAALLLLAFGLLLDEPLPLPDEEQAASTATAARATPAVAVFWMRTRCILKEPLFSSPRTVRPRPIAVGQARTIRRIGWRTGWTDADQNVAAPS